MKTHHASITRIIFLFTLLVTLLGSLLFASASLTTAQTTTLKVTLKKKPNGQDNNNRSDFYFKVVNQSAAAVSGITVRVYFTLDGSQPASNYVLEKFFDQSGAAVVQGPTLSSGSTYYFTVNYGAASLPANGGWEFQTQLHLADWTNNLDSTNDWWHTTGALPGSYTDWPTLPAYVSGVLTWGSEPGGGTPAPTSTFTNTPTGPTATFTRTNTPLPPTNTPTRTNTPTGPTATPTRTNTPAPPTNTPTRTNTPAPTPTGSTCGAGNLALGKPYTSSVAASGTYPDTGGIELTDGLYGPEAYTGAEWQGRLITGDYFQTVDLGLVCGIGEMFTNFLQDTAGVVWPTNVSFAYSTDGTNFTNLGNAIPQTAVGKTKKFKLTVSTVNARYVRMTVTNGNWSFEDEMEVSDPTLPTATPTKTPTPGPTAPPNTNVWEGSFIQPWLTNGWGATQWSTEFQYMKNVKMDHLIWQWTVDSLPSRKWTYYPTTMAGFTQTNSNDAVGLSLQQAQIKGLKVWLGLNWTDDWWTHYANDNVWLTNEFNISKNVAQELWNLYGGQYGNTIAGFYMTMEMDNVNFQTQTTQDRMIAVYADVANYIHTHTGKPVMVAPFFNENYPGGQNQTQYANMWGYIITGAPIDVVAVQDGIGVDHATVATIASWLSPLRTAIKTARPSTQFWVDLETLTPSFSPAPVSRVIQQLEAEKAYVDKVTTFSFNHYDSPQQGQTTNYNAWKAYTDTH